jgi:hypothetical protein
MIITPYQLCDIVDLRGIQYFCCEKMNDMVQKIAADETQKEIRVVLFIS